MNFEGKIDTHPSERASRKIIAIPKDLPCLSEWVAWLGETLERTENGIPKTFPMSGYPRGPGGRGSLDAFRCAAMRMEDTRIATTANVESMLYLHDSGGGGIHHR